MTRKIRTINKVQVIEDPKILEFIQNQKPKTAKTYMCNFKKVLEFTKNESGQKMLDESELWSRKIFGFQRFLEAQGYSQTSIQNCVGCVRGFFSYFKKQLDLSDGDKRKLNVKARNSEDYILTVDDIKHMSESLSNVGSVQYQKEAYVLKVGLSFGLRAEDFSKLTFGKYRLALERAKKENVSVPIPLGVVETEKETGVKARPFISSDALPCIEAILESNKDAKDEDRVFTERPSQLTEILQNLAKRANIQLHGQRLRFHGLRKVTFDALSSVASEEKAKAIIGKKVSDSDSAYLNDSSLREIYNRAMPKFTLNGNGTVLKGRVTELEEENKKLKEKIAELEASHTEDEQNFSKVFARLDAIEKEREEREQKKPVKVQFD